MFDSTLISAFRIATIFCVGSLTAQAARFSVADAGHAAVVKIFVSTQRENAIMPWQSGSQASGTGTGFIISNKRILTNAHLVGDARFIEVQKDGNATRYRATVRFVAHDCDLAMLEVSDDAFFINTRPLTLADRLPRLNDEVIVLGYPLGGDRLSVTKGVVSRMEYANYAHSGVDQHLALQVDAAINPGNSGGPVLFGGRVVGLAFQGLAWAENIGYAIPLPVVQHFLTDVADGERHDYPEMGLAFMNLRNDALRADLKLPPGADTGVLIFFVDPYGAGYGRLQPGDVLLAMDGSPIANDGTVQLSGETLLFAELLERKQWGETVTVKLWRNGEAQTIAIPLDNPPDPFAYRFEYDRRPSYIMLGGLVFTPLSQELMRQLPRASPSANLQYLSYTMQYVKADDLHKGRDAFIVLSGRLPHPVNTYLDSFQYGVVDEVNGVHIRNMHDLQKALAKPDGDFHRIRFVNSEDILVIGVDAARLAEPDILRAYNVPESAYIEEAP